METRKNLEEVEKIIQGVKQGDISIPDGTTLICSYYTTLFKSCVPEKSETTIHGHEICPECTKHGRNQAIDQLNKNMERSGL